MTNQNLPSADPRRNSVRWLALVALAGVLAAGCSNGKAKDKESADSEKNATVPVEVQPLKRAEMVAVYSGTAPIEAHEEATVVAKVGGEVRQIYVEEGDAVQAGQVLARLDEFVLARCPDCQALWIRDTLDLLPDNCAACRVAAPPD